MRAGQRVVLAAALELKSGRQLPAGLAGVVRAPASDGAYEVEFDDCFVDLSAADVETTLADQVAEIHRRLRENPVQYLPGVRPELHQLPPFIPKQLWTELGDCVKAAERPDPAGRVPGERWITLRLDGSGFSSKLRQLRRLGVFQPGYSPEFAHIMRSCVQSVMAEFHGKCGYTQSDEMTVVIPPASVVRGEQMVHIRGGRVVKICTLAAAHVTSRFNFMVAALCAKTGVEYTEQMLATFDCRMGSYATKEEALGLLLWRAYDCGVNGVQDAVFHRRGDPRYPGGSEVQKRGTGLKLQWLAHQRLLPLEPHQAKGSFFVKVRRLTEGVDPRTGETRPCVRSVVEECTVPLLLLQKERGTLLEDDLPDDEIEAAPAAEAGE
eukprot:TRINITY_DN46856_c0_g1_i1.p1 TRINITY_DN46856_c0_g1~~TRINITY_DN46856_c0_g1_i1.p1  ORF type:complete len:380 (+),score=128.75 TRINITY_DN46856_c0_g1_i1:79-1218(+)